MVERQVRDQPPDQAFAQRDAHRGGGLAQAADVFDHRVGRDVEITALATERQQQGYITVAAGQADAQGVAGAVDQLQVAVDHADAHRRGIALVAPAGNPEAVVRVLLATRLEERLAGADVVDATELAYAPHPVDRHHFRCVVQANVRGDRVFVLGVGELDRLGLLAEQVDDRRAVELEIVAPDVLGQPRQALAEVVIVEVEVDLDLLDGLALQDAGKT
ncbi:hypothetical protein D3C78_1207200 [compost metagenome]